MTTAQRTVITAKCVIREVGPRLHVWWVMPHPDLTHEVNQSFRDHFPRHDQAVWLSSERVWSLPNTGSSRDRLERWARQLFGGNGGMVEWQTEGEG